MTTIGKVTVGATTHHKIRIDQTFKTTIANPNLEPRKPQLSLDELSDVSTNNVRDRYTIQYNASTKTYETAPIELGEVEIPNIVGGYF